MYRRSALVSLAPVLVLSALSASALTNALAQAQDAAVKKEEPSFARQEDVIYGRKYGTALTMDVFTPAKANGAGVNVVVSAPVTNSGTIEAAGGNRLALSAVNIDNSNGRIASLSGSFVDLTSNVTVKGGTLAGTDPRYTGLYAAPHQILERVLEAAGGIPRALDEHRADPAALKMAAHERLDNRQIGGFGGELNEVGKFLELKAEGAAK